jgi:hypothetical protein
MGPLAGLPAKLNFVERNIIITTANATQIYLRSNGPLQLFPVQQETAMGYGLGNFPICGR